MELLTEILSYILEFFADNQKSTVKKFLLYIVIGIIIFSYIAIKSGVSYEKVLLVDGLILIVIFIFLLLIGFTLKKKG